MNLCQNKSELIFIRHSSPIKTNKLFGATDVKANIDDIKKIFTIRSKFRNIKQFYISPAKRCVQTFKKIWPERNIIRRDKRLWEQNFGKWEGLNFSQIPNIGELSNMELSKYVIPEGESFNKMCDRVQPAIREISKKAMSKSSIIVCHSGTVRAAIALAVRSNSKSLQYKIDYLSITRIKVLKNGQFFMISHNKNILN